MLVLYYSQSLGTTYAVNLFSRDDIEASRDGRIAPLHHEVMAAIGEGLRSDSDDIS
jgi:hypothetical protein